MKASQEKRFKRKNDSYIEYTNSSPQKSSQSASSQFFPLTFRFPDNDLYQNKYKQRKSYNESMYNQNKDQNSSMCSSPVRVTVKSNYESSFSTQNSLDNNTNFFKSDIIVQPNYVERMKNSSFEKIKISKDNSLSLAKSEGQKALLKQRKGDLMNEEILKSRDLKPSIHREHKGKKLKKSEGQSKTKNEINISIPEQPKSTSQKQMMIENSDDILFSKKKEANTFSPIMFNFHDSDEFMLEMRKKIGCLLEKVNDNDKKIAKLQDILTNQIEDCSREEEMVFLIEENNNNIETILKHRTEHFGVEERIQKLLKETEKVEQENTEMFSHINAYYTSFDQNESSGKYLLDETRRYCEELRSLTSSLKNIYKMKEMIDYYERQNENKRNFLYKLKKVKSNLMKY